MAEISGGDLPDGTSEIFLRRGLDTKFAKLPVGQITGGLRGGLPCFNEQIGKQIWKNNPRSPTQIEYKRK
jgi:hypothetical protein